MQLRIVIYIGVAAVVVQAAPRLIWEENFDTLDENKWHHLVTASDGGHHEFQYYRNSPKNSWVDGGTLKIRPTPTSEERSDPQIRYGILYDPNCNQQPCVSESGPDSVKPVFSAHLHTQGSFDVAYSRVQVRAKISRGDWLRPGIWMKPGQDTFYGPWPSSGEIDLMESCGNRDLRDAAGRSVGVDVVTTSLHWGTTQHDDQVNMTTWTKQINNSSDFSADFHIYEVERTPDHITFRVDGQDVGSVAPPDGGFWELGGFGGDFDIWVSGDHMAPFDRPFYLILNVAVGGSYFTDDLVNGPNARPWDWTSDHPMLQFYEAQESWTSTWDRPQMEIDYIRVYELS